MDDAITASLIWVRLGAVWLPMIHPESKRRLCWVILGLVFIAIEALCIPYSMVFQVSPEGVVVRWLVDIFFMCDLLVQFLTAYVNEVGHLITEPWAVWRRYLASWFLLDFIASFPWQLIGIAGSPARLTRIIRITRILKAKRTQQLLDKTLQGNFKVAFVIGIVRVIVTMNVVIHWCACIWYVAAAESEEYEGVNWIDAHLPNHIKDLDRLEHHWTFYQWSLYFTMTTMTTVGYGDISPTSTHETRRVFLFLGMCAFVFSAQMGSLGQLVANLNEDIHDKRHQIVVLARYLRWRNVPRKLHASIYNHCAFLWETSRGHHAYERELRGMLTPVLNKNLFDHIYGGMLRGAPFLMWMQDSHRAMQHLATIIETIFCERGDFLFRRNQDNDTIHIVTSGTCQVHQKTPGSSSPSILSVELEDAVLRASSATDFYEQHLGMLGRPETDHHGTYALHKPQPDQWNVRMDEDPELFKIGSFGVKSPSFFGESCLWLKAMPSECRDDDARLRAYSLLCLEHCEVLKMPLDNVLEVLELYPSIQERFEEVGRSLYLHSLRRLATTSGLDPN
eukprot:gnl/MRDRNA2_/MRDRNA2_86374_c0_seq5.p1 gnl/MRDRNA2_/MRDRNA2_86374_c0~~gnl/MRDRNA2_/MRDRNA2_86374_c0_seq5.p1  ORF type:complete len:591 (-),score=62.25 gnl/MRDRNA2_/MRDRNA2_86374_c0_seq5:349-2037(-)